MLAVSNVKDNMSYWEKQKVIQTFLLNDAQSYAKWIFCGNFVK
jgi:hypothetical protein